MPVTGIIGDDGEAARGPRLHEAVDQGVNELNRRAGAAEAADHDRGVVADGGHRLGGCGDRLVHRCLWCTLRRSFPMA